VRLPVPLFASQPDWSPDGKQIAILGNTGPGPPSNGGIFVINADGSGLRKVISADLKFGIEDLDWGSSQIGPSQLSLAVSGLRSQRLDRRNRLQLFVKCSKACVVTATASTHVGKKRVRNDTSTRRRASTQLIAGKRTKIYLKFLRNPARLISAALKGKKRVVFKVKLQATEPGETTPAKAVRRIRVR
jgi:hypothetical protein